MKKVKKLLVCILALVLAVATCAVTACGKQGDPKNSASLSASVSESASDSGSASASVDNVSVKIDAPATTNIRKGITVTLSVTVSGTTDKALVWSTNPEGILSVDAENTVRVTGDVTVDTSVTVTAALKSDASKSDSVTFTVQPIGGESSLKDLTPAVIEEIANPSITVTGELTDYYYDYLNTYNSTTRSYDFTVKMEQDKWQGDWSARGIDSVISDKYVKGEQYKNEGHALTRAYINKDNEVALEPVTDYMSVPILWENMHLWNHLGTLAVDIANKFEYDSTNDVYRYLADLSAVEEGAEGSSDLYFMTYLSYSLTPMLEDTLQELYIKVENGHVAYIIGETEKLLYGEDDTKDPDAMSYSAFTITFSDIGTTAVADPAPYDAPEHAELLSAALETMKTTTNYTFRAVDNETRAPVADEGDYETASASASAEVMNISTSGKVSNIAYNNNTSAVGTVGTIGWVTEDAYLYAETGKYDYAMDDNIYYTKYFGYRNFGDHYEYFEYNNEGGVGGFIGRRRYSGDYQQIMPKFELSANVFKLVGMMGGNYIFELRDSAITYEVAMQISTYKYAEDADGSVESSLRITVNSAGQLVSTSYPYSFLQGDYAGIVTTTYSDVGTTALETGAFDNYVERQYKSSWDLYTTKDFCPNHSNTDGYGENKVHDHEVNTVEVFKYLFGEDGAAEVPAPTVFMDVFGDAISDEYGPWFDYDERTNAAGETYWREYFEFNVSTDRVDRNSQLSDEEYQKIKGALNTQLTALGYEYSAGNSTDASGSRYMCFVNEHVTIVVNNIGGAYFFVNFYKTGEWTLSR